MKLSLILPVYNPAEGWADIVLTKSKELISMHSDLDFEIIIVNDGSNSRIFQEGHQRFGESHFRVLQYHPNRGKGHALRVGVEACSGDIIVYTDIDFPYTIESISQVIYDLKRKKANMVIGVKDLSYYGHVPALRRFISRIFRFFVRLFLHIPTDDTQCGLKGFDRLGKNIFLKTTIDRYLFDLEFVYLASHDKDINIHIREIKLREDVQFRKMNFSIVINEVWNFLKILLH